MAAHDVEEYVARGIELVLLAELSDEEKITYIHNLYRFHDSYDTATRRSQYVEELTGIGYFHAFPPEQHPLYAAHRNAFDKWTGGDYCLIPDHPDRPETVGCYWMADEAGGSLYCEPAQALWSALTGKQRPEDWEPLTLHLHLAQLGDQAGDLAFLGIAYTMAPYALEETAGYEERPEYTQLRALLCREEVFANVDKLDFRSPHPWYDAYFAWSGTGTQEGTPKEAVAPVSPQQPSLVGGFVWKDEDKFHNTPAFASIRVSLLGCADRALRLEGVPREDADLLAQARRQIGRLCALDQKTLAVSLEACIANGEPGNIAALMLDGNPAVSLVYDERRGFVFLFQYQLDRHYSYGVLQMDPFPPDDQTAAEMPTVRVGSTLYLDRLTTMDFPDTTEGQVAFAKQAVRFLRRIYDERHGWEQVAVILKLLIQRAEQFPDSRELCKACIKVVCHSGKEAGAEQHIILLDRLCTLAEKDDDYLYHLAASMESHIPEHFPVLERLYREYVLPANPQHILLAELTVDKLCSRIDYRDDVAQILSMAEGAAERHLHSEGIQRHTMFTLMYCTPKRQLAPVLDRLEERVQRSIHKQSLSGHYAYLMKELIAGTKSQAKQEEYRQRGYRLQRLCCKDLPEYPEDAVDSRFRYTLHQEAWDYAKAVSRDSSPEEITTAIQRLDGLYIAYPEDPEIAYCLAYATEKYLHMLSLDDAEVVIDWLGEFAQAHEDNHRLLGKYADALMTLAVLNFDGKPEDMEEQERVARTYLERLETLARQYPTVADVQHWYAHCLDYMRTRVPVITRKEFETRMVENYQRLGRIPEFV